MEYFGERLRGNLVKLNLLELAHRGIMALFFLSCGYLTRTSSETKRSAAGASGPPILSCFILF